MNTAIILPETFIYMSTSGHLGQVTINKDLMFSTSQCGVIDMVTIIQVLYKLGYNIDRTHPQMCNLWRAFGSLCGYVKAGCPCRELTEREAMIILIESFGRF